MVKLFERSNFLNGNYNGSYLEWNEKGKKLIEANYVDGLEDREYKEWHLNGKKAIRATYNLGKPRYGYVARLYGPQRDRADSDESTWALCGPKLHVGFRPGPDSPMRGKLSTKAHLFLVCMQCY